MTIWTQTLKGKAFDLLNVDPTMIDFNEIADTLAHLNRYAGATDLPVSVAMHTLIAIDAAELDDKPYLAAHDAHEYVLGEFPTPAVQAMAELARINFGPHFGDIAKTLLPSLKRHVDLAIWRAAGLQPPDEARRQRIHQADLIALSTERRDFLARSPKPWRPEIEAAAPLRKHYGWRAAPYIADDLRKAFKQYLPALKKQAA